MSRLMHSTGVFCMGINKSNYVCSKCGRGQWITSSSNQFAGSTCCGVKLLKRDKPSELKRIAKAKKDLKRLGVLL